MFTGKGVLAREVFSNVECGEQRVKVCIWKERKKGGRGWVGESGKKIRQMLYWVVGPVWCVRESGRVYVCVI